MRPACNLGVIIDVDALIVLGRRARGFIAHGPIIYGEDDAR